MGQIWLSSGEALGGGDIVSLAVFGFKHHLAAGELKTVNFKFFVSRKQIWLARSSSLTPPWSKFSKYFD